MGNNPESNDQSEKSSIYNLPNKEESFDENLFEYYFENVTTKNTEDLYSKNKIFEIEKKSRKKSGRKRTRDNGNSNKIHSKNDYDNIIRKIQVHYHNFLVSFFNEILKYFGINQKFLKIDYEFKKDVKLKNVENLKTKEIGEILRQNISPKYREKYNNDKEINNKLYLEVIKYDNIRKILSEKYINIFKNFYYKNKRDLNDYGLNIQLSNNVKTYQDLLEKYSKESDYREKIINYGKKCYISE